MLQTPRAQRLRSPARLSYKVSADKICRRRRRGSPALLARLLTRLGQDRDLYALHIWERGGVVPRSYRPVRVHRGRRWRVLTPSKWHAGLTWGALARTRRVAAFKARAANKKRKKVSKGAQLVGEMRIMQYRALQLGQRRRTSTKAAPGLEDQIRSMGH
jgi:hypothetical protein